MILPAALKRHTGAQSFTLKVVSVPYGARHHGSREEGRPAYDRCARGFCLSSGARLQTSLSAQITAKTSALHFRAG